LIKLDQIIEVGTISSYFLFKVSLCLDKELILEVVNSYFFNSELLSPETVISVAELSPTTTGKDLKLKYQ